MSYLISKSSLIYLFIDSLVLLFALIALFNSIKILRYWDFNSFSESQYRLEKLSYLNILLLSFILSIKIALLPYFIFLVDDLKSYVVGAMCGVGVINSNQFGNPLLLSKVIVIYLSGFWLLLNRADILVKDYRYTKLKYKFFILISLFIAIEYTLSLTYLLNIDIENPVQCCSIVFSLSDIQDGIFLSKETLLTLFILSFALSILTLLFKRVYLNIVSNLLYISFAYFAIVYIFSPYIYQLPTHQCPFCMFQAEYFYVGYFIFGYLMLGTFFSFAYSLGEIFISKSSRYLILLSLIFNTIFILLIFGYPIGYYIANGAVL